MERKLADQNLVGVIVIRKNAVPFEGRDLIRELINYLETKGYHVLPKEDSEECHVAYFK
ncbi:MAG: hypothetical protein NTW17_02750 [Candidatus Pacearchaeota archaeon]|nr:hypothetical protein [Candidatus Pacearchaeota archaeon]